MKVVHLNASDKRGGAALTALRLHRGLRESGVDSCYLVENKLGEDEAVSEFRKPFSASELDSKLDALIHAYNHRNRTPLSNTHFTVESHGWDLRSHPMVKEADVIHLHWISTFMNPVSIRRILELGKPVVWTLHDMGAFTGGCHYSAGCRKFEEHCNTCPQLAVDPFELTARVLRDKKSTWNLQNLTLVGPSAWILEEAGKSALFGKVSRMEHLPNVVNHDCFQPGDQAEARKRLGLHDDVIYLMTGADVVVEKRKGMHLLGEALRICSGRRITERPKLAVVTAGQGHAFLDGCGFPIVDVGLKDSEEQMADLYRACDMYVLPSLEDNQPTMVVEAAACGRPVIAFNIGGVSELVRHEATGLLCSAGSAEEMADMIDALIASPSKREALGRSAHQHIEEHYAARDAIARHAELYRNLVGKERGSSACGAVDHAGELIQPRVGPGPQVMQIQEDLLDYCSSEEVLTQLGGDGRLEDCVPPASRPFTLERFSRLIRFTDWWYPKIPVVLTICWVLALMQGTPPASTLLVVFCILISIVSVASYGHVINDMFDIDEDAAAGKKNGMMAIKPHNRWLMFFGCIALGFLPMSMLAYGPWGVGLLALNYLLPTVYSIKPFRLKERGILGVLSDAGGSHIVPGMFILMVFAAQDAHVPDFQMVSMGLILLWSIALGLKGILYHQESDRENDQASNTSTWVGSISRGSMKRFLASYNLGVELTINLLVATLLLPWCPAALLALLGYCLVESVKCSRKYVFALNQNPENNRANLPFANNLYYDVWLPFAVSAQLAWEYPSLAWLPVLLVLAFLREYRVWWKDLASLFRRAGHA